MPVKSGRCIKRQLKQNIVFCVFSWIHYKDNIFHLNFMPGTHSKRAGRGARKVYVNKVLGMLFRQVLWAWALLRWTDLHIATFPGPSRLLSASICDGTFDVFVHIAWVTCTSVKAPLLLKHMLPSKWPLFQGRPCLFQQDNALVHIVHVLQQCGFMVKRVQVLDWSACRPDLSSNMCAA